MQNAISKKITVTTRIDPEQYKYIREDLKMSLTTFIDESVKMFGIIGMDLESAREITNKVRFFANKTVDLQNQLNALRTEKNRLDVQINALKRKFNAFNK